MVDGGIKEAGLWTQPTNGINKWYISSGQKSGGGYSGDWYLDDFYIRKYVDPEPTHGSWGIEEASDVTTVIGTVIGTLIVISKLKLKKKRNLVISRKYSR